MVAKTVSPPPPSNPLSREQSAVHDVYAPPMMNATGDGFVASGGYPPGYKDATNSPPVQRGHSRQDSHGRVLKSSNSALRNVALRKDATTEQPMRPMPSNDSESSSSFEKGE